MYCPNCAYKLTGTEKFCPECSYKLVPREERAINIGNTSGDVIAAGASGSGNIIGKEVGYTIQGNVLNLQITGNVSTEVLDTLQRMMSISTRVEQACIITKDTFSTKETAHKQIKNVLEEVNKIEKKTGTEIEEIRAGDLQMSRNDLLLKEIILKGNEDFYKKEYKGAIK